MRKQKDIFATGRTDAVDAPGGLASLGQCVSHVKNEKSIQRLVNITGLRGHD